MISRTKSSHPLEFRFSLRSTQIALHIEKDKLSLTANDLRIIGEANAARQWTTQKSF